MKVTAEKGAEGLWELQQGLRSVADVHTHRSDLQAPLPPGGAIVCVPLPLEGELPSQGAFSVAIHPWDSAMAPQLLEEQWRRVERLGSLPQVAAIGETGLDKLRGAPLPAQRELFLRHARLAEELRKPLIIHNVRCTPQLMELKRALRPQVPWLLHGFRGGAQEAQQLARAGFLLSFGEHGRPEAYAAVPPQQRYVETDTSALSITQIRERLEGLSRE